MNDSFPRPGIGFKLAALTAACFLLASSLGLFYVGYLTWAAAGVATPGLPVFGLALFAALGGGGLLKHVLLPETGDEWG